MTRMRIAVPLMVLGACSAVPAAAPSPAEAPPAAVPLSADALAGRCFRLLRADGAPVHRAGAFWSAPVRLDTARSVRLGAMPLPRPDGTFVLVTLAPASASLTGDTLRTSSHWSVEPPETLRLVRSTGFVGETVTLRRVGSHWAGERERWDDVVIPNEVRNVHPVRLVPAECTEALAADGGK
ncbi:MAG: hypothetical protein KY467_15335 [Gemmatimonadetes bacterium]|nr:hypothetical protein [Gemmatimonadota bacterium]